MDQNKNKPMRNLFFKIVVVTLIFNSSYLLASSSAARQVFLNGSIHTFNKQLEIIEAISIKDGVIEQIGSNEEIKKIIDKNTSVINLEGKMMMPSFHDAHSHPIWSGIDQYKCVVSELYEIEGMRSEIKECLNSELTKTTGWLVGTGLNIGIFPAGNPNKSLLDEISTDIPIYVDASDGHSGLANSKALELAGITANTSNPEQGIIERDPNTGEPSGTLREPAAMNLVRDITPKDTDALYDKGLNFAQDLAHSFGITSSIAASVGKQHMATYKRAAVNNQLNLRVITCLSFGGLFVRNSGSFDDVLKDRAQYSDPRINVDCVKIFIDGVLEGQTGAVLEPYLDSGNYGQLYFDQDTLNHAVARFDADNIQIHTHAIGDRAVRSILDAFEFAIAINGRTDNRHHISHLQMIDPADIPRFKELGVAANFQAAWALPDEWITDINTPELGIKRVNKMYPIASVFRAGGLIVGGSDWAVSTMNPLVAIETAIRREDPDDRIQGVLNENERMTLVEMLKAYTINAAYLMHQEHLTGSIEVGKAADLIILERNLYDIPIEEISEVRVLETIIEGKTVYRTE
ncbi:MAG TPA: amidohydrolase [Gammaproteobacteria bacterium]|jgi:predicted amidohydrolase YtcJ|nr:amidohydrolase [Gammaproteobacteria bacterium]HIK76367.1 amidohydrolase [Gammaproteobacteria bacterium]